jgi:hypothetical protein
MAEAPLGQIDARLKEIDALLFKADPGQISIGPAKRSKVESEAESILTLLSNGLAKDRKLDPRTVYDMRQNLRQADYIVAVTQRDLELRPEANPERDAIVGAVSKWLDDGTKARAGIASELASIYSYMFVEQPKQIKKMDAPQATRRGLLRRNCEFERHLQY